MRRLVASLVAVASWSLAGCVLLFPAEVPSIEGWSATPTAPLPEFRAAAERDCLPQLPFVPDVVLQDQRGPDGALFVFRGEGQDGSCSIVRFSDGHLGMNASVGWGIWFGEGALESHSGSVTRAGLSSTSTISEEVGAYPEGTERVTLELDDGTVVEATVADQRFAAWWPTEAEVVLIRALDASGATISSIPSTDD